MKLVIAIIQPHKLDSVRAALLGLNVEGMTVTEVRGYGRQKGHKEVSVGCAARLYMPWEAATNGMLSTTADKSPMAMTTSD